MTIDTARLQMTWAVAAQYGHQVRLFFCSRLFVTHPELRDMFPLSMEPQRDKLVAALGSVVSGVDDLPAIVPVLEQLGRDHRRCLVVRDHYPALGEALLAALGHFRPRGQAVGRQPPHPGPAASGPRRLAGSPQLSGGRRRPVLAREGRLPATAGLDAHLHRNPHCRRTPARRHR
jgi:hemoglobin-like flavoprotein